MQILSNTHEIQIESGRIMIRPFSAMDADETYRCITPALTRFMAWEPPADRAAFDSVWQAWLPAIVDRSDFTFAIRQQGERKERTFLGLAGLHRVVGANAELGIWIREDRHGEGLGREAVTLVSQWASQTLGITRFTYPVAEANFSSRRIAESLGGVIIERRTTPKYDSVVYEIPEQVQKR